MLMKVLKPAKDLSQHGGDERFRNKRNFAAHLLYHVEKGAQTTQVHVLHDEMDEILRVIASENSDDVPVLRFQAEIDFV